MGADTHNMSSNFSLAQLLISCIVLFAAIAATYPSIDGQEFEETLPTALPDSKFAVGQEMAAAMEEVQDTTKAKSEETSQTGWGRRRRRRRRRRWMGSPAERNQKAQAQARARETANKEKANQAELPKEKPMEVGERHEKAGEKKYRLRVMYA